MTRLSKVVVFVLLYLCVLSTFAQTVELTFTGRDAYGKYVQLSQVTITNQSKGWSESLSWPDTTLLLINATNKIVDRDKTVPFVGRNVPNPFDGITELEVNHIDGGVVRLSIYNITGQLLSMYSGNLPAGRYRFQLSIAKPQVCMVVAQSNVRYGSAKILNMGYGTHDGVEYLGSLNGIQKGLSIQSFENGDRMTYVGSAIKSGNTLQSTPVTQNQYGSEIITLRFNDMPQVETGLVSDITSESATCGGKVTIDGGAVVTARGVCLSTAQNPTIADSHTIDGRGVGSFTSSLSGLWAATTYYVRAYATNSVGTAYGKEVSFTTAAGLPFVMTGEVTAITATSATCGGNVTIDGGSEVIARGVCYGISHNPTIDDNKTTNGTGKGDFTSDITGLVAGTTYYVRAYATNIAGTAYGEEKSFTTLTIPTISTADVNNITGSTATCGGNVTADGGATVTARGVCWSTTRNPTTSNSKTTDGTGIGGFTSNLTGLAGGTTYYVRAYAINSEGTAYGNEVCFTTVVDIPAVTTAPVTSITVSSALCGGNVIADGGATVTARGVCWSTSHNPTITGNHTVDGSGTGSYTSSMTGLTAGTTYYVRAYATNRVGISYGEEVSFTAVTPFTCGTSTIKDIDNNIYNTVQIGSQCWMKENLKTTKYADGTSISQGSSTSTTVAYWYYPNNSSSNKAAYGLLYNWKAVMRSSSSSSANPSGVQGVCPTGWHVPSDAEWTQLTDYVSSQSQYQCNSSSSNIAKALASTTGWNTSSSTCAVGNTQSTNNSTGLSAVPAGYYNGSYGNFGSSADFWSATESNSDYAYGRRLDYGSAYVSRRFSGKSYGFSVRCLRD